MSSSWRRKRKLRKGKLPKKSSKKSGRVERNVEMLRLQRRQKLFAGSFVFGKAHSGLKYSFGSRYDRALACVSVEKAKIFVFFYSA